MRGIYHDLRYALRALRRAPAFAAAVVLTLSVSIGATSAIFAIADRTILNPVQVVRPSELFVGVVERGLRAPYDFVTYRDYQRLRAHDRTVAALAAYHHRDAGIAIGQRSFRVVAGLVSGSYFPLIGLPPARGRLLGPADEGAADASPTAVLSHAFWQRAFAGRDDVIGAVVHINGHPFNVVGVAPDRFAGLDLSASPDIWVPLTMIRTVAVAGPFAQNILETSWFTWLRLVGRQQRGSSLASVRAELATAYAQLLAENAQAARRTRAATPPTIAVIPLSEAVGIADRSSNKLPVLKRFVTLLFGVVALTLIICCVNVANLMLVRSVRRARELGVHAALGAGPGRLMRQLGIEAAVLAIAGGIGGIAVGWMALRLFKAFDLPGAVALGRLDVQLDARAFAFTFGVSMLAALAFGLAPALRAARLDLSRLLRQGDGHRRIAGLAARELLVSAQIAATLLLVIGAGLFVRSVRAALAADPGFDASPVAAVDLNLRQQNYTPERARAYIAASVERARSIPGVSQAAMAHHVPIAVSRQTLSIWPLDTPEPRDSAVRSGLNVVSDGYFATLGTPMVSGRDFNRSEADRPRPNVAIINEAAARTFWPSSDPLNRRLQLVVRGPGDTITVVGVVRNAKYHSMSDADVPYVFLPATAASMQWGLLDNATLIARGERAVPSPRLLERAIAAIDPSVPTTNAREVQRQIDVVMMPQRFGMVLLGTLSLVALAVSLVGVHGVVAHTVALRRDEIAIRLALGASPRRVLATVAGRTLTAAIAGIIGGGVIAVLISRALRSFLYGVRPTDPWTVAVAAAILLTATLVASWTPARAAMKIDPARVARSG